MESKNTTKEVFGRRLKELRKANGYTIEQFAEELGIAKSTLGYYENEKRMPDVEILSKICDTLNVPADYLLGRTNTVAMKGKMKTVCELTGLSDEAADFLSELVRYRRYDTVAILNYLLEDYANDYNNNYDYQARDNLEGASSVLNALLHYMREYSKIERSDDFADSADPAYGNKLAAAYKQLLINRIVDAVKVGTEEYKERRIEVNCFGV